MIALAALGYARIVAFGAADIENDLEVQVRRPAAILAFRAEFSKLLACHESTGNFKKIPKTEGAIECMDLPDEFPSDIDYAKYIEETTEILRDLGYFGEIKPPQKRIRITKANRRAVLSQFAVAP